jgi:rhodanese-related sulfurtransferase
MKNISAEEFKRRIELDEKAVIIDVRSPEEEVEGIIEGGINMNIMDPSFPSKVQELDNNKNYYLYCRSGSRSFNAGQYMEQFGLKAFNLAGGIQAWNLLNH